jgi:hypothetical protein
MYAHTAIPPSLQNAPVRAYPLPPISQPPVFIAGERQGQRVVPHGVGGQRPGMPGAPGLGGMAGPMGGMGPMGGAGVVPPGMAGMTPAGVMPAGMADRGALLAHQAMEHRALAAGRAGPGVPPGAYPGGAPPGAHLGAAGTVPGAAAVAGHQQQQQPQQSLVEEEERDVSTRTVAAARYTRNHDWMNEVFAYAAFGDKVLPSKPKRLHEIFDKDDLANRVVRSHLP